MKQNQIVLLAVAVVAVGGAVSWYGWPTGPKPTLPRVEILRKQVAANANDYAGRVELADLMLTAALGDARQLAKEDEAFVDRKDFGAAARKATGEDIQARREKIKATILEVEGYITAATKIAPEKIEAYRVGVKILKMRGKWKELRTFVDAARKLPGMEEDGELREASMLADLGLMRIQEAEDEAHRLAAADPSNIHAKLMIARLGMLRRDIALADKTLQEMSALSLPDEPFVQESYGILLRERVQIAASLLPLRRAVALLPEMATFRYELASAYNTVSDHARVIQQHSLLNRLDPTDPYVYLGRAGTYHLQNMDYEAAQYLLQAERLAPEDPQILFRTAKFLFETPNPMVRDLVKARLCAEEAARVSKFANVEILRLYSMILAKSGDFKKAIEISETAMNLTNKYGLHELFVELRTENAEYVRLSKQNFQEPEQIRPMPPGGMFPGVAMPPETMPGNIDLLPEFRLSPDAAPATQPAATRGAETKP